MYAVSEDYKKAINAHTRTVQLSGEIILASGTRITFDDSNVLTGSVSLSEQAVSGLDIEIGNVYMSEFKITFINSTFSDSIQFDQAKILPIFSLLINEDTDEWEDVPLGVFHVVEPEKMYATTSLVCYDNMLALNGIREDRATSGTVYELLKNICDETGLELANTAVELQTFVNSSDIVMVPSSFEALTSYRDLVGYLAQLLSCFALFERDGRLRLIKIPFQEIVKRIDTDSRISTKISDYETGISSVQIQIDERVLTSEKSGILGNNLILENPLFVQGTEAFQQQRLDNILNEISQVRYIPSDVSFVGDPALQPGDWIEYTNGVASQPIGGMLTHSTWKYRGYHELKSVGKNPAVKAGSNDNTTLSPSQVIQLTNYYYNYENLTDILFGNDFKEEVITILFSSSVDTFAFFHATVNVEIFEDNPEAILEFTYYVNNVEVLFIYPKQSVTKGRHIVHLYLPIQVFENRSYLFTTVMKSNCSGKILSQEIQATINGQGLYAEKADWDGIITVSDFHSGFKLESLGFKLSELDAEISMDIQSPVQIDLNDEYQSFNLETKALQLSRQEERLLIQDTHYIYSEYDFSLQSNPLRLAELNEDIEGGTDQ
ncbi:hypothetical protein IW492_02630 [Enterococcus sp. BWB1-3]|uniref:hypothetical protein n=1 Tax=Enterococcus sp. BWB1-3 TaxID=2787713 RepID=UPI00192313ED|nr:hypothetical protein [Enterococcus sp. BWB1-3]MBL1228127.1 hypothetical protein [Enterococcus sp. BWB1-3]